MGPAVGGALHGPATGEDMCPAGKHGIEFEVDGICTKCVDESEKREVEEGKN